MNVGTAGEDGEGHARKDYLMRIFICLLGVLLLAAQCLSELAETSLPEFSQIPQGDSPAEEVVSRGYRPQLFVGRCDLREEFRGHTGPRRLLPCELL